MKNIIGSFELLDRIKPLWVKLNIFHSELNNPFSGNLLNRSFEDRKQEISNHASKIHIEIVIDDIDVGYCISTINESGVGEIDSLYIIDEYRHQGIGESLVQNALAWFSEHEVKKRTIKVMNGNIQALSFYEKFGFVPCLIELTEMKQPNQLIDPTWTTPNFKSNVYFPSGS